MKQILSYSDINPSYTDLHQFTIAMSSNQVGLEARMCVTHENEQRQLGSCKQGLAHTCGSSSSVSSSSRECWEATLAGVANALLLGVPKLPLEVGL